MSDSEQCQLHVPYREYNSNNSTTPATLVNTEAFVDLSVSQISNSAILGNNDTITLLPEVDFAPNPSLVDQTITIDSPGADRESQPLLGRLELDITYNRFPGMLII